MSRWLAPTPRQAILELVAAGVLWGFSFIAARWALAGPDPAWICTLRMGSAVLLSLPLLSFVPTLRRSLTREQLKLATVPGILLGVTMVLQVYGLERTTVTKNAFLTTLYVVLVPLVDWVRIRRPIDLPQALLLVMAIAGTALLSQVEAGDWNLGDGLTLICAFTSALHIASVEVAAPRIKSAFIFNGSQSLIAGVLCLAVALVLAPAPTWVFPSIVWYGIGALALVTVVAFLVQIRSQRVLPGSTVSVLFLLEAPFAAFFAFLIFHEALTPLQWVGAVLILLAAGATAFRHAVPAPATEPVVYRPKS